MSASKNNLQFEYLFRDESNFKTFGQLVFSNPKNLSSETASNLLKKKLIDEEYFYPSKAGVSEFAKCPFEFDTNWYEFVGFANTEIDATQDISVNDFISKFKAK